MQRPPRLVPAPSSTSAHEGPRPAFSSEFPQLHYAFHGTEHLAQPLGNSWTRTQLHAPLSAPGENSETFQFGLNMAPPRSTYFSSEYNPFPSSNVRAPPALFGGGVALHHPSPIPTTLSSHRAGYLPASEYGTHTGGLLAHNPAGHQSYYGEQPVAPPTHTRPGTTELSLHDYQPAPSSLALQFPELPDRPPQFTDIRNLSSAPSVQAPVPLNSTMPSVTRYGTTPLGTSVLNSGWNSEQYSTAERIERCQAPAVGQPAFAGALNEDEAAGQQQQEQQPATYGGLQQQSKMYQGPTR